ncbi:energy-coupling factor transport system permease protein [Proteiniborus ethanoligenes]|uniref:Energy-coupling factor transport system permease protein n=1 Tax=Proteiniborus ethanoligenes TaxID=415015 RepID=A0A1H3RQM5_9FIRM|nr:energy-coupling factor transporter transmembrane component T [Proteiniborus ethanoligenes]SDZ27675.1 energy-coupling factor transport system permease protein [Proteiniborus ethanoligenes]
MDMFLYIDKNTFLHRLDPRTKLLVMFGSFAIALLFNSLPILIGLGIVIFLYGQSGRVLSNLKRIRVILFMIALMSIIIWSLTKGGETKLLGPITLEGLLHGIMIGLKFDIMIISGMIFLSSTKIEEISLGLVKLKVPYRGAFAFSTAIRLVPMIVGTSYTITQAQKSRGLDLDSGTLFQKAKKYVPLLIPTLISVIRGTNVFSMALESKGFGYDKERTNYMEIGFDGKDYALMVITILAVIFSIYSKIAFKL